MMIDFGEDVAQCVTGTDSMEQDGFDIYVVECFGSKNVLVLVEFAWRSGRVRTTRQTLTQRQ